MAEEITRLTNFLMANCSRPIEWLLNGCWSGAVFETHRGSVENFSDHPSVRGIASRQVLEHPFNFEPDIRSVTKRAHGIEFICLLTGQW